MTHRPGWTINEPCPNGDSWDITEYRIRPGTGAIRTGWDRGDCGHDATWIAQPGDQASHAVERRLLAVMPLHAITTLYGEKACGNGSRWKPPGSTARPTDARSTERSS